MAIRPQIEHRLIVAYLRGECDEEQRNRLLEIRRNDPVWQMLFDLIDRLGNQVEPRRTPAVAQTAISFPETEEILIDLFSGGIQEEKAQRFLDALIASPDLLRRLLLKLTAAKPELAADAVPELSQVQIRSDEELMGEVIAGVKGAIPRRKSVPSVSQVWDNLREVLSPVRLPRFAFALLLLIAASTATWLVYENLLKEDPFAEYVYDDRVPYEYQGSSLRGSSSALQVDSLFQVFVNRFKLAMADYMTRDYTSAIGMLEDLAFTAHAMEATSSQERYVPWLRDYYFYLGVSHLAMSSSRRSKLSAEANEQHGERSIRWLARADSLVSVHALVKGDRENYFLGLAWGLGGRSDLALAQLREVTPESENYEVSRKLIHKLSE